MFGVWVWSPVSALPPTKAAERSKWRGSFYPEAWNDVRVSPLHTHGLGWEGTFGEGADANSITDTQQHLQLHIYSHALETMGLAQIGSCVFVGQPRGSQTFSQVSVLSTPPKYFPYSVTIWHKLPEHKSSSGATRMWSELIMWFKVTLSI